MSKIKAYISSFRLRTLPLSLSGILLGILLAAQDGITNFITVILLINTTLCLQILSNLANEYGDAIKNTDNTNSLTPKRGLQSGLLSKKDIMRAIIVFIVLSVINGISLLVYALDNFFSSEGLAFLILGGTSILAALFYTIGKHAYGYKGLGEIFVFIFFGLVSTMGAYVLSGGLNFKILILPASAIGLLSCAVLNINNMRDIENDQKCGKMTIAARLGIQNAKIYHYIMIISAIIAQIFFHYQINESNHFPYLYFIMPLFIIHIYMIYRSKSSNLDKQMPLLSLNTLLFAILSGI